MKKQPETAAEVIAEMDRVWDDWKYRNEHVPPGIEGRLYIIEAQMHLALGGLQMCLKMLAAKEAAERELF